MTEQNEAQDSEKTASLNFLENIIEEDIKSGKNNSEVHTRFPPEPNGYLHIGHAKSICLNFGLAKKYSAPCNLRFDDTNPAKEDQEYVDSIKKDVQWLGFQWAGDIKYTSDYFDQLYQWALKLIKEGKAYVDHQTSEQIAEQKGEPTIAGTESPYRNTSVEENLAEFEKMRTGVYPDGACVLRAKIDMASPNMHMRDPIMYRIINKEHHRTGNKWCIYPMYDYAHGQSDYLEGITHSICTLEFEVHRPLYEWFLDQVYSAGHRPRQYEFARLNLSYTVMSKRKLLQLVTEGHVTGWDDPRMPTISGLRRRGYTPESIRRFCETIGVARRENIIDVALLEFSVRDHLNKIAPRVMAVLDPIKVVIDNYPDGKTEYVTIENNPEDLSTGNREVPFGKEVYIERDDFMEDAPKKFFRLRPGSEVRLKGAYIIKAESVVKDADGNITEIHCSYDADSLSGTGSEASMRKVKGTLHWVPVKEAVSAEVRLYDRLFNDEAPDGHKDHDFKEYLNPSSLTVINDAKMEPSIKKFKAGDSMQFQRIGYFCVDPDSTENKMVFNRTVGLKDSWAKEQKKA
ncbi:MAG: glutamine--tRNA ligase/YqeY domain fusion protein [Flavobacteriales bacterium]|nr:glutamine--tRNA ligase/YqeY domain fusion protein [Flavobacteriales bacterium]